MQLVHASYGHLGLLREMHFKIIFNFSLGGGLGALGIPPAAGSIPVVNPAAGAAAAPASGIAPAAGSAAGAPGGAGGAAPGAGLMGMFSPELMQQMLAGMGGARNQAVRKS